MLKGEWVSRSYSVLNKHPLPLLWYLNLLSHKITLSHKELLPFSFPRSVPCSPYIPLQTRISHYMPLHTLISPECRHVHLYLPLDPPCAPNLRRRIGNALPGRPKMPFMVSFNRTHRFLKAGRCNLKTFQKCPAPLLTTPYHNPLHPNL